MIIIVIVPCPSSLSLVPHRRPGPSSSVCVTCVRSWVLAIVCGLWWVVVVGHGSFFWGWQLFLCVGHHLCSFWGVCCHFWVVVLDGGLLVLMWWQGSHWSLLGVSLVWWWWWLTKGNHITQCLVGHLFGHRCETNKQLDSVAFHSCKFCRTFQSQFRNAQILLE